LSQALDVLILLGRLELIQYLQSSPWSRFENLKRWISCLSMVSRIFLPCEKGVVTINHH
jgi:hypothetical protein